MSRESRGVMLRSMQQAQRGAAARAGGKEGKRALGPRAREAITAAHRSAAEGAHAAAAEAFTSLAGIAGDRGLHAVGSFFAVQAAQAQLAAGSTAQAIDAARIGIALAETVSNKRRVARPYGHLHAALAAVDGAAAEQLASEVKERFGLKLLPTPGTGAAPNRAQRRALGRSCPSCGAATADLSLRFEDDGTVDCPRCGEALG